MDGRRNEDAPVLVIWHRRDMDALSCIVDSELAVFAEATARWRATDPIRNNVASTVIDARLGGAVPLVGDELWLRLVDAGTVVGLALHTPPFPLLLLAPDLNLIDPLVETLRRIRPTLSGVGGPLTGAEEFARRWAAPGTAPRVGSVHRMFVLDGLRAPTGIPGRLRRADAPDTALLAEWSTAFSAEALPDEPIPADAVENVARRLSVGVPYWLWEVDGEAVSMMATSPPALGISRVQSVYTPPERRRHGYAAAMVAAACAETRARPDVDEVVLFADVANPTSSGVYRRIGFSDLHDVAQFLFDAPEDTTSD
ncbi:GNAT family N-acetyltransferase [Stackebrandtia soli]|uniref:GNAT family N-acetyltransferase n=1 Tax=Stackebrandtia soli TaxID=1892856 RepID=UPI0039E86D09